MKAEMDATPVQGVPHAFGNCGSPMAGVEQEAPQADRVEVHVVRLRDVGLGPLIKAAEAVHCCCKAVISTSILRGSRGRGSRRPNPSTSIRLIRSDSRVRASTISSVARNSPWPSLSTTT